MKRLEHCPGCECQELSAPFVLPNQPVILNYRFGSVAEAEAVPRGDVTLVQCRRCRLIFNATFDPAVMPYDEKYENRQCLSPAFTDYLRGLALDLIAQNHLRGGRILEVGCGKGDFLKLICREAAASGVGYDTSFEGELALPEARLEFHRRYVRAADIRGPFDAVLCRHVIEHVAGVGEFLRELRMIAQAAGDPVVILETPRFEWIQEQGTFWDVFYEHCNYFTEPSLAYLAGRAGFILSRQSAVFDGQYQLLEMRAAQVPTVETSPPEERVESELSAFARSFESAREQLERKLLEAGAARGWAVWGAGAKGVAMVNQITIPPPKFVIDTNPMKQGCVIPGSRVAVVSPDNPAVLDVPVILVMNPNYFAEIQQFLVSKGYHHTLLQA